ncbi:MAG: replicative helicase loader/inhibitor [Hespellia sp.]|nr:replicative helicase loader/inhibitor [Hespellia sp.]
MNKEEFATIAIGIKSAYPASKVLEDKASMDFWYMMLQDMDYKIVQNAVLEHISTNTFPPSIAEIRKQCAARFGKQIKSFDEAWGTVQKAVSTYGWERPLEAYEKMDELTVEVVKNIGWNNICHGNNPDATRANFRMAYEEKANAVRSRKQLPMFVEREKSLLIEQYVPKEYQIEEKKQEEIPEKESPAGEGPPEHIKQRLNELLRR